MKTTIDMAQEAQISDTTIEFYQQELKAFEALVRADERNSWPAEMEAMERQVNILTDALAAEREACAKVCDALHYEVDAYGAQCAAAIRARGQA